MVQVPISAAEACGLSSSALDVFSLGRVLAFALTGVHPNSNATFEKIERTVLRRPSFQRGKARGPVRKIKRRSELSVPAQALLVALTADEPAERPAVQSKAVHEWLRMMTDADAQKLLTAEFLGKGKMNARLERSMSKMSTAEKHVDASITSAVHFADIS